MHVCACVRASVRACASECGCVRERENMSVCVSV